MKNAKTTVIRNGGVVLRRITNRSGSVSLVLDMHKYGQREREWLGSNFLLTGISKREDSKRLKLAISIAIQRAHELRDLTYGLHSLTLRKTDLVDFYYKLATETRDRHRVRAKTWLASYNHLKKFSNGKPVPFNCVSHQFCAEYRSYLTHHLKTNSARLYFSHFKTALNESVRRQILPSNPSAYVCGIRVEESNKSYLTKEELAILTATPCPNPHVKTAFEFMCHTGIRLSDVKALLWRNIMDGVMRIQQQKTRRSVTIPLNATATALAGIRGNDDEAVFQLPASDDVTRRCLRKWVTNSGITKQISPHSGRHTFATLLLSSDVPVHTIMKLLGHSKIATTLIYSHVQESALVSAVKNLDY